MNVEKKERHCERVSVKVVNEALNVMEIRKAARLSDVTSELIKVVKSVSVKKLVKVGNHIALRKTKA